MLAASLAGCGGTITYGSSAKASPPKQFQEPVFPTAPVSPPPGTTPGTLLAFDALTGNPLWQSQAPMADMGPPIVSKGMVFVQGDYGGPPFRLAAFNPRNGDLIWRVENPVACGETSFGPTILLVAGCEQTTGPLGMQLLLRALEPNTGRVLWTTEGAGAAAGSGIVLLLVQAPTGEFKVRGLDPPTGRQLWEAKLTTTNISPLVNGQVALVWQYGCPTSTNPPDVTTSTCGPGEARSFLSRLDLATGTPMWQAGFGQGGQLHRLLLGDVAVFSVTVEIPPAPGQPPSEGPTPGAIGALDPATGAELWRQTVSGDSSVPALAVPGTVYVEQITSTNAPAQCPNMRLDALDSKSGTPRWLIDNLKVCELAVAADGQAVVLVMTSFSATKIVVLDAATGTELWERPMANRGLYPLVHASVASGVVYVSASGQFPIPSPVAGD